MLLLLKYPKCKDILNNTKSTLQAHLLKQAKSKPMEVATRLELTRTVPLMMMLTNIHKAQWMIQTSQSICLRDMSLLMSVWEQGPQTLHRADSEVIKVSKANLKKARRSQSKESQPVRKSLWVPKLMLELLILSNSKPGRADSLVMSQATFKKPC